MAVLARLAALGCLGMACASASRPADVLGWVLASFALFTAGMHGRSPSCFCAHGKGAHERYGPGAHCSLCACPKFRAPITFRRKA